MVTLKEAKMEMARLTINAHNYWEEHVGNRPGGKRPDQEAVDKYNNLLNYINCYGEELAANPDFFDRLVCWSVSVFGNGSYDDRVEFEKIIEKQGFQISGAGCGCGGWDFEVHCNDRGAKKLCQFLYFKFRKEIEKGSISVGRSPIEFRFKDIQCADRAEAYLRENEKKK
jgi:hypothetical protein